MKTAVAIKKLSFRRWRNENPGEGGISTIAETQLGTIGLGADGHRLVPVEGGWRSVPCSAVEAHEGDTLMLEMTCLGWRVVGVIEFDRRKHRTPGRLARQIRRGLAR